MPVGVATMVGSVLMTTASVGDVSFCSLAFLTLSPAPDVCGRPTLPRLAGLLDGLLSVDMEEHADPSLLVSHSSTNLSSSFLAKNSFIKNIHYISVLHLKFWSLP